MKFLTNLVVAVLGSLCFLSLQVFAGTSISVENDYKKEINIKIQGTGVGGCDITMQPGEQNPSSCWCLWGTINYSFCAYYKMTAEEMKAQEAKNTTLPAQLGSGKCPIITGESLLCSDLSSLGNCYDGSYSCTVDVNGFCNCHAN